MCPNTKCKPQSKSQLTVTQNKERLLMTNPANHSHDKSGIEVWLRLRRHPPENVMTVYYDPSTISADDYISPVVVKLTFEDREES